MHRLTPIFLLLALLPGLLFPGGLALRLCMCSGLLAMLQEGAVCACAPVNTCCDQDPEEDRDPDHERCCIALELAAPEHKPFWVPHEGLGSPIVAAHSVYEAAIVFDPVVIHPRPEPAPPPGWRRSFAPLLI